MDKFYRELINAVKIFNANEGEEIEDEKISFLKYCFKNIEGRDPEGLIVCNEMFEKLGASVEGYYYDEDLDSYTLFGTIYKQDDSGVEVIDETSFNYNLNRIKNIIKKTSEESYDDFDDSSKTFDVCEQLKDGISKEADIIIIIYSNYKIPDELKIDGMNSVFDKNGKKVNVFFKTYDLIDLKEKLDQLSKDSIELDCSSKFKALMPALKISSNNDFDVYMCSMNGSWLAKLYKEDGVRLLEPNVRSYLKRTSKTNSGIFETIKVCPENFVTFNNGLSTVATDIVFENTNSQFITISKLVNFQIVNGGQTTATLAEALKEPSIRSNLNDIIVPVKLTVVKNLSNASRLIGDISVFSNTQTAIKKSDPPSNLPFYIAIKKLSNECISNESGINYVCYFERTAGEYDTELRRNNSTKTFSKANPSNRKFNKIELANAINAWEQLPNIVSLGKEKSFSYFNQTIKNQLKDPDQAYFKKAYALIIIMKHMDKRAKKLGLSYKSNVITYALSFISKATKKRLDLLDIWDRKAVPANLHEFIDDALDLAHRLISNTPSMYPEARMWARKEDCWNKICCVQMDCINVPLAKEPTILFEENQHLLYIKQNERFFDPSIWSKLILWNDKYKVLNKSQINMIKMVKTKCLESNLVFTKKQRDNAEDIFLVAVKNKFEY